MFYKIKQRRKYSPLTTFAQDVEAGLTSDTFNTRQNVLVGDKRPGLESDDVVAIMAEYKCTFDQARLIRTQRKMRENGIDPLTGLPLDPKAVVFSSS